MITVRDVIASVRWDEPHKNGYTVSVPVGDERADAILAALAAGGKVVEDDWQTIESAPAGDAATWVLVAGRHEYYHVQIGMLLNGQWVGQEADFVTCDPTHWRPLPTAPTHPAQEGGR